MSCGKNNVIPGFYPYLMEYRTPPPSWGSFSLDLNGKIAYNLGFQAYNLFEGDVLTWSVKDNSRNWQNVLFASDFMIESSANWSFEESLTLANRLPKSSMSFIMKLTVQREGKTHVVQKAIHTQSFGLGSGKSFQEWRLFTDGQIFEKISFDGNNVLFNSIDGTYMVKDCFEYEKLKEFRPVETEGGLFLEKRLKDRGINPDYLKFLVWK